MNASLRRRCPAGGSPGRSAAQEARGLVAIEISIVAKDSKKARELSANLLENLLVAPSNGIAGAAKRGGRIERPENGFFWDLSLQ